jgi:PBP1b-binding outer membrane lipoprotein LpoB
MKNYIVITILLFAIFISGCGGMMQPARTPSDTLRALNEATKKKDVEAIKKLLSKGTLALIDKNAATQKTTSDELLTRDAGATFRELPEIRGEKIEGDTATVEVKPEEGTQNEKIPLVKEDGEWKVALDKYVEDIRKRMLEDMNKPKTENENPANKP